MSSEDKFDCIVVGAGPSGIAAAYTMAKAGLNVIVLERGSFPGAKNLFGGVLFTTILDQLVPSFWEEAPVERHVISRRFCYLTKESQVGVDLMSQKYAEAPFNNSFIVLRSKFDQWFAQKAEGAGVQMLTGVIVDDFVCKDGKIIGIKARGEQEGLYDELYADVVICAEGANSMLAEKAGMRKGKSLMSSHNRSTAVKEIIRLPEEVINDRFHLAGKEGTAIEYFGDAAGGMLGSGFIYTNKDSISVGVGCEIGDLIENKTRLYDQLDYFKSHPAVRNLVRGGETVEYSTHMIPEDSYGAMPQLYTDGLMLVGDCGGFINSSIFHEVTNLAMASGMYAAETVIDAKRRGDYSAQTLSLYKTKLEESFVFQDMRYFKKFFHFIQNNRAFLTQYPTLAVEMMIDLFTVTQASKKQIRNKLIIKFMKQVNIFKLMLDMAKAAWVAV
ncbi:MAG TPA: FAD-dependent oxidoreductase [bacterium]|nr:FAD-dependent oxidoreductase [bacterium]